MRDAIIQIEYLAVLKGDIRYSAPEELFCGYSQVKTTGACCPPAHRGGGNRGLAGRMTGQKREAQQTSLRAQSLGSTEQGETK